MKQRTREREREGTNVEGFVEWAAKRKEDYMISLEPISAGVGNRGRPTIIRINRPVNEVVILPPSNSREVNGKSEKSMDKSVHSLRYYSS